jgi:NDP-hexose-3-ketoreductase
MSKIKIGVLGYANISKKAVIPAILNLPSDFILVAIASRNKNKIKSDFISCLYFNNYEDIIDSSIVDALYIPLPNALHYLWVKKALINGIHVLVEKSLACSFSEVEELNNLALQNDCVLIENFQFRFHSQLDFIKKTIESGKIGKIRSITSSFGFPPFLDKDNIRYNKDLGGGALLDAGAYPIKLAQELLGYDLKIKSAVLNYENLDVDIWGGGLIKQINGELYLHFSFGFDNFYQCNLEIWGSLGKLLTKRIYTAAPDYSPEVYIESNDGVEKIILEPDNHFIKMLLHFYECINSKQLRIIEYKQNINQSKLLNQFKEISYEK